MPLASLLRHVFTLPPLLTQIDTNLFILEFLSFHNLYQYFFLVFLIFTTFLGVLMFIKNSYYHKYFCLALSTVRKLQDILASLNLCGITNFHSKNIGTCSIDHMLIGSEETGGWLSPELSCKIASIDHLQSLPIQDV